MVLQRAHFLDEQTKARGYGWTRYVGVGGVCVSAASSVTQQGFGGAGVQSTPTRVPCWLVWPPVRSLPCVL